ncbi:MAG: ABC transporter permease [Candidatus Pacearchaeota archaeon]
MIKDYFFLAFKNLKHRGIRSWLTILGIFIGITAIVTFITLGQGMNNYINEQFSQLGTDIIIIMGKAGQIVSPIASSVSSKPLTTEDVDLIKKIPGVKIVSPMNVYPSNIRYGKESVSTFIYGIEPKDIEELFMTLESFKIESGRMLKETDKYSAIVGARFHEEFNKKIGIGSKIEINGTSFEIVGILKQVGNPQDDKSIYIPNKALKEIKKNPDVVSVIYVKTENQDNVKDIAKKIEEKLMKSRKENENEKSFAVSTSEQLLEIIKNILTVINVVFIGIAAISLFVGGVGIMNTMYTSVLERTREIGIMKAIGAKNSDIMIIFLIEAGLLGLVGGIFGIILGILISKGIEYITINFYGITLLKIATSWITIIFVLLFSFLIGCLSGTLPAIKASKLNPVDALRYE